MPFINKSPLNYPLNSPDSIRIFEDNRAPTTTDFRNFKVGDEWWDTASNDFWKLVFKDSTQGIWRKMAGTASAVETFIPDAGTSPVVPDGANQITLTGGTGITTTGGLNTMTWAIDGDVFMQVTAEDATTAVPAANNLNIVGTATNGINTTAAGSTLTISMATPYSDGDFEFRNATAATSRTLSVTNTDVNVASSAQLLIESEPLSADPFLRLNINGTAGFSYGIDNSDSDTLKLTNGADPSSGTTLYSQTDAATSFFVQDVSNTFATAATATSLLNIHSDNTNAASHSEIGAQTGGANGGDPFVHFEIDTVVEKSIGFDNSDSDIFKITTGATPSAGTTHWSMTTAGERTMPLQPAFLATNSAIDNNVTGAGTTFTVIFDSEKFDQNADFDGTSTFTAPVTGRYLLITQVALVNLTAAMTAEQFDITTSNRVYQILENPGAQRNAGGGTTNAFRPSIYAICDMDAADTAIVNMNVDFGAGDTADIDGTGANAITYFCGNLLV